MTKKRRVPDELMANRQQLECNFIFSLWQDMADIDAYKSIVNGTDIITEDGMFYYGILTQLNKLGYTVIDEATLSVFLADKKALKDGFDNRGGVKTIQEITSLIDINNKEGYHDALVKSTALINLHKMGFGIDLKKVSQMTSNEVYDYYTYKLNSIFVDKIQKVNTECLSDGYEPYIDEWDKGVMVGTKIGYPILNYRLSGVHKKNLLLHMAHIGNGKTTSAILFYILPAIAAGENVCIMANEQDVQEFRQMILASVLFNKIKYRGMDRQKFVRGHFSTEQRDAMMMAADWLKKQPGKIEYVELTDYAITTVRKVIRKYSKLGFDLFVFDTLKPETESSDRAWAEFSETAKELFLLAKTEEVPIIATAQLSGESNSRRFLDMSSIGKSKAIGETATQVVMFRSMSSDEKSKLFVYSYKKDSDGKYIKDQIVLDPEREYIILFTPKNRFGSTGPQIVYERNLSFNTMYEIGYTVVEYDGFKVR